MEDSPCASLKWFFCRAPNHLYCHRTLLQKAFNLVDIYITLKESSIWHPVLYRCWRPPIKLIREKSSQNLRQIAFPRWPNQVCTRLSLLFLTLLSFSLSWKDNTLMCTPKSITKGEYTSDSWICHQKPDSVDESRDPLVHFNTNGCAITPLISCGKCLEALA